MSISLIFCMCCITLEKAYGQLPDPPPGINWDSLTSQRFHCGLSPAIIQAAATDSTGHFISGYLSSIYGTPTPPSTATIFNCSSGSKFDITYEDVNLGTDDGFDDTTSVTSTALGATTLGAVRRYTFCQVISYVESTINFSSVSPTDHVRIDVERSYTAANPATSSTHYYAVAYPNYNGASTGIIGGYVNDYVTGTYGAGVDPCPAGTYHGFIQVNFDSVYSPAGLAVYIPWQNDVSEPYVNCDIDLFSTMLHEMAHCLGFYSLVTFPTIQDSFLPPCNCVYGSTPIIFGTPVSIANPHLFTKLDNSIYAGTLPAPLTTKLITMSSGLPIINPLAPAASYNYWLNGTGAPDNHPLFSGSALDTVAYQSFLDHFDDQLLSYSLRERISPGDRMEYVMGPFGIPGALHRIYTKGEMSALVNSLGYTYIGTSPWMVTNHLPYSRTMGNYALNEYDYGNFAESVAPDTTIINNTGTTITINIASPHFASDFIDSDGDAITIDTTTIVNLRGCGIGGNNHNLLSWAGVNPTKITYTPRANFYGKAQFGFNIYDGKEDGSFRVVTIEVLKGTNISPSFAPGNNMVCNGDFKEGSEEKLQGAASTEAIPNTYTSDQYLHEGKWQGICFSDSHPYDFFSDNANTFFGDFSGILVENSWINCNGVSETREEGDEDLSFDGTFGHPFAPGDTTDRYQRLFLGQSYYYLDTEMYQCHRYKLEFDIFENIDYYPAPSPAAITVGFGDHINIDTPVYNFSFLNSFPTTVGSWVHDTVAFWYCGSDSSNIMHFAYNFYNDVFIDNIKLTQYTTVPPLTVTVTPTLIPGCETVLTANVVNAACDTTYAWTATAGTTLSAQTDTVMSATDETYTVTVNDGCRSTTATATVTYIPPIAITGDSLVCTGSALPLGEAATDGSWSSSSTGIATVSVTGIVIGMTAGTATISYTDNCGVFVTKTITVNPTPDPITGSTQVCSGSTIILSNATPGGSWASTNTSRATVDPATGVVTGGTSTGGIVYITYTLSTGCMVSRGIVINPVPDSITGDIAICTGSGTITLHDVTIGGSWSSGDPAIATVDDLTGIVTGVAAGTAVITYTISGDCSAIAIVTFNPLPPGITGTLNVCQGLTTMLADATAGGTWSSSATAIATVEADGTVSGVSTGTAIITYTLPTGCATTTVVTINPLPAAITGSGALCAGSTTAWSDSTTGGTWSSSNTAVASVDESTGLVGGITAGSATITYTTGNGCIATAAINVYSPTDPCSPCVALAGGAFADLTGPVTAAVPAGNYYVAGDITIAGAIAMTDAIIFIGPGAHIYVAPASSLTLNGCHLYSCPRNMWNGIVLQSDGTQTGTVTLQGDGPDPRYGNSTLIEDAIDGVDAEYLECPTGGAANFVQSYNTIFNHNDTGIKVTNYFLDTTTCTATPLDIENTVFTSRSLWGSYSGPFAWPGASVLKQTVTMPSPYLAPFNVANYNYAPCHVITSPEVGIYINRIGTGLHDVYPAVVVGAPNTANPYGVGAGNYQQNLFDTLNYGIYALDANLTVINNAFAHMSMNGGTGVFGTVTTGAYQLSVQAGVYHSGGLGGGYTNTSPNYFYNCATAVYAGNYAFVYGTRSYMITTQNNSNCCGGGSFIGSSYYGYNVITTQNHIITIDDNSIINTDNGIAVKVPGPSGLLALSPLPPGQITIDSNTIQATPAGMAQPGNSYVDKPIWVDLPLTTLRAFTTIAAQVNTDHNVLTNTYNGIYINGVNAQVSTSFNNMINEVEYPGGLNNRWPQYGVYHGACVNDWVWENNITGTDSLNPYWEAVQMMSGIMHTVSCNDVSTMGVGFEFNGTGISSRWTSNNMTNTGKGFLLGGIIGPQGDSTHLSYNQWLTTGSFAWTGTNYQTMTENSILPTSSPLYVIAGAILDPVNNQNNFHTFSDIYGWVGGTTITGSGNGLIVLPGSDWPVDWECYTPRQISKDMLERMVQKDLDYITNPNINFWIGQYDVWLALQQIDTLADTSAILTAFKTMAENSRFALLTNIENDLAIGDAADAQALLNAYSIDSLKNTQTDSSTGVQMADDTTADNVVMNYREYYQLYINYMNDTMSGSDSAAVTAMANLCPLTYGDAVFKARALYDIIFDTLVLFPNTCSDSVVYDSSGMRESHSTGVPINNAVQKYTLYPNPNDGNFILQQQVADSKPVQVEIQNVIGQSIYKAFMQFSTTTNALQLGSIIPGLYLLQVTDSAGRIFKFKFVVE